VGAKLVHVASEPFPIVAPDWFWSDLLIGDLARSAVFDDAKVRRFVPSFAPKVGVIVVVVLAVIVLGAALHRSAHPFVVTLVPT
jgi:hypothetical protein